MGQNLKGRSIYGVCAGLCLRKMWFFGSGLSGLGHPNYNE